MGIVSVKNEIAMSSRPWKYYRLHHIGNELNVGVSGHIILRVIRPGVRLVLLTSYPSI